MSYTFKRRFTETDGWTPADYNFNQKLAELKKRFEEILDDDCCVFLLLKQYFYKSATAPDFQFCFDWEDFEYLLKKDKFFCAGDIVEIYIISSDQIIFNYKVPDENGLIPEKGSY